MLEYFFKNGIFSNFLFCYRRCIKKRAIFSAWISNSTNFKISAQMRYLFKESVSFVCQHRIRDSITKIARSEETAGGSRIWLEKRELFYFLRFVCMQSVGFHIIAIIRIPTTTKKKNKNHLRTQPRLHPLSVPFHYDSRLSRSLDLEPHINSVGSSPSRCGRNSKRKKKKNWYTDT